MTVRGRDTKAFTRRKARRNLGILARQLGDVDDDGLVPKRNVGIFETDTDATERAEGRDSLFGLSNETRAVRLSDFESDALFDDARTRGFVAANDDLFDDDLFAFGDRKAHASAR